jgi:hypothetical protein
MMQLHGRMHGRVHRAPSRWYRTQACTHPVSSQTSAAVAAETNQGVRLVHDGVAAAIAWRSALAATAKRQLLAHLLQPTDRPATAAATAKTQHTCTSANI